MKSKQSDQQKVAENSSGQQSIREDSREGSGTAVPRTEIENRIWVYVYSLWIQRVSDRSQEEAWQFAAGKADEVIRHIRRDYSSSV